jgi:hypothetical protein
LIANKTYIPVKKYNTLFEIPGINPKKSQTNNKTTGYNIFNQYPKNAVSLFSYSFPVFIEYQREASTNCIRATNANIRDIAFFFGFWVFLKIYKQTSEPIV